MYQKHSWMKYTIFFLRYKDLRKGEVQIGKWGNARQAKRAIKKSIKLYSNTYK